MDERKPATMTEVLSVSVECQMLNVVVDWDGAQTSSCYVAPILHV